MGGFSIICFLPQTSGTEQTAGMRLSLLPPRNCCGPWGSSFCSCPHSGFQHVPEPNGKHRELVLFPGRLRLRKYSPMSQRVNPVSPCVLSPVSAHPDAPSSPQEPTSPPRQPHVCSAQTPASAASAFQGQNFPFCPFFSCSSGQRPEAGGTQAALTVASLPSFSPFPSAQRREGAEPGRGERGGHRGTREGRSRGRRSGARGSGGR